MKRFVIIGTFLAASVAMGGSWSGAGAAGPPPCKECHDSGGEAEGHAEPPVIMAKVLRLSEAQQAKIREISREGRHEHMALMKRMKENRGLLREKCSEAKFDEAGVGTLAEREGALVARMIVSRAVVRNKIRAVLSPEQRELYDRIQPLLERGPLPPPCLYDGKSPPFMGMAMARRSHLQGDEIPPCMEPLPGDCPPCVAEY